LEVKNGASFWGKACYAGVDTRPRHQQKGSDTGLLHSQVKAIAVHVQTEGTLYEQLALLLWSLQSSSISNQAITGNQ
jgi:hypothetical protein